MKQIGLALLVVLATGCDRQDDQICSKAPKLSERESYEACVHRWGYRLARSNDPADIVADAVVGACADRISRNAKASYAADQAAGDGTTSEFEFQEAIRHFAKSDAIFRVVQARAGECEIS